MDLDFDLDLDLVLDLELDFEKVSSECLLFFIFQPILFAHKRCRCILSFNLRPALSYILVYLSNKCGPVRRVLCSC